MKPIIFPLTKTTRLHISSSDDEIHICKEQLANTIYDYDGHPTYEEDWAPASEHEYSDCTISIHISELDLFLEHMSRLQKLLLLK